MNSLIAKKLNDLNDLCKHYTVKSLHLFGSAATTKFNSNSDIDFLIAFEKNISIAEYTDNYFSLQYKLRSLFDREIDLVTENSLSNPYFIQEIEKNKKLIYAV